MRPEDLNKFFEEAFEKVEPKDDAEREKLAKLREKIREGNERMVREIARAKKQTERLIRPSSDALGPIIEERTRIAKESRAALIVAFEEHTELIERIASAVCP